jgi:WD repeat-containing protein 61
LYHAEKSIELTGHEGSVYTLEHGPEPEIIFSGGSDKLVSAWNINALEDVKGIVNVGSVIYALKFIREKNLLLIGVSGGGMHVVDLQQKKETRFLIHHQQGIFDIQYSLKNNRVYTASAEGTITSWTLDTLLPLKTLQLCKEKVRAIAIEKQQEILVAACGDGTIRIVDAVQFNEISQVKAHESSVNCIAFHPDGKRLISGGKDAYLRIWDFEDFELMQSIPAHNYAIYSIAFSAGQNIFATASRDKTVKIWDAETCSFLIRLDNEKSGGHNHSVNKLLWLEDGMLMSTGDDRRIIGWKVRNY